MSYRHIYDPVALNEYKEAVSWYLERSELAAEGFVKELNEKIAVVCNDPFRFRNTYKNYREISLNKYPYYHVNTEVVIAVEYYYRASEKYRYIYTIGATISSFSQMLLILLSFTLGIYIIINRKQYTWKTNTLALMLGVSLFLFFSAMMIYAMLK